MVRLKQYIHYHFSILFFSIFLPLFIIASIVFLVNIASITAYVKLTPLEMFNLYLFFLPELLFYTLPISFFVGGAMTLSKLSFDYELVVLFTMGISPKKLMGIFAVLATTMSAILLLISLIVTPHAKQIYKNFLAIKKSEAQFNISATELGQKFGEWLLFIDSEIDDREYKGVVLYNESPKEEKLIIAQRAKIVNEDGILRFQLYDGKVFYYTSDSMTQIDYKKMNLNDLSTASTKPYRNTYEYWNDMFDSHISESDFRQKRFTSNVLIALFPLLSLFIMFAISIFNTRHQRSHTYLSIFATILIFYGALFSIVEVAYFYTTPIIILIWLLITRLIYKKTISPIY